MIPEERVEYLNGQLFDARRLMDEQKAATQKWYDEAHEKRRELRRLEEQLEAERELVEEAHRFALVLAELKVTTRSFAEAWLDKYRALREPFADAQAWRDAAAAAWTGDASSPAKEPSA